MVVLSKGAIILYYIIAVNGRWSLSFIAGRWLLFALLKATMNKGDDDFCVILVSDCIFYIFSVENSAFILNSA